MDLEEFAQDLLQDVHAESDADGQFLEPFLPTCLRHQRPLELL